MDPGRQPLVVSNCQEMHHYIVSGKVKTASEDRRCAPHLCPHYYLIYVLISASPEAYPCLMCLTCIFIIMFSVATEPEVGVTLHCISTGSRYHCKKQCTCRSARAPAMLLCLQLYTPEPRHLCHFHFCLLS